MAVGKLSGGEQSRILLAQLMLREAQILVLDEPTNDLDLATLAVLEETLTEFDGAVLLVSHDRYFLDQVATTILAFDASAAGVVPFASLSQWEAWRAEAAAAERAQPRRRRKRARQRPARAPLAAVVSATWSSASTRRSRRRIARAEAELQAAVADSEHPDNASDAARAGRSCWPPSIRNAPRSTACTRAGPSSRRSSPD